MKILKNGELTAVQRNAELARDLLHQVKLLTPDAEEQAGALVTALTVLVEMMHGVSKSESVLMTMLAATLADWREAGAATVQ